MATAAPKSKFFRVAVEGATSDGRTIDRNWIEQMAATYNPATYGARVNLEHRRGADPSGPFGSYGDVTALKTEEVDLAIGGKTEKRLALMAQITPTAQAIALNKASQKIYTSIEVAPDFAKTGKAYLVGLGMTDSPASLGTDMLTFAAQNPAASPYAERKQAPENLFTAALETKIEFDDAPTDADVGTFAALLEKMGIKFAKASDPAPAAKPPVDPSSAAPDTTAALTAMAGELGKIAAFSEAMAAKIDERFAAIGTRVDGLATKFETTEAPGDKRPLAIGNTSYALTDC